MRKFERWGGVASGMQGVRLGWADGLTEAEGQQLCSCSCVGQQQIQRKQCWRAVVGCHIQHGVDCERSPQHANIASAVCATFNH